MHAAAYLRYLVSGACAAFAALLLALNLSEMKNETEPNQTGPRPPGDLNPRVDAPLDFPDREYGDMSAGDYEALGFMSGLEVHQQLLTRSKLFCRCPAGHRATGYDAEVLRHMRPTLSELGEYDGTALMEFKTKKEIVYQLERGSVCTYEMDDTPPFEVDEEAVRGAIEISLLLNLNLVSELHVMRKQYLDGSIPTGFQRTAMVGLTGAIPFRVPEVGANRELSIRQLSLEEDSCREMADVGHRVTFRTDRLGTPLIETGTEPELVTPLELQAAGRLLAHLAQVTGKVRRGPGAARQDVNVSVAGGRRVEIKGVDNHKGLPLLVHTEAFRQLNLLRVREELRRRGVESGMLDVLDAGFPWDVSPHVVDASVILRDSDFAPIRQALDRGERIYAIRLPGFGGLLTHRTQPGVTFAREFADRIRVIACPVHRPFMIHSDIRDYGLDARQWRHLSKQLKADAGDAMVVVWANEQDADTAVREVFIRAKDALVGVPSETRQAFQDGTNGFERILPGPDRMYPDTDTPPLPIADEVVEAVVAQLPETPWDREDRYLTLGLSARAARHLARSEWAGLFDALAPAEGRVARRLAGALEKRIPHHRRTGAMESLPEAARVAPAVRALETGEVRLEAFERILDTLVLDWAVPPEEALARYRKDPDDAAELEVRLGEVVRNAEELAGKHTEAVAEWGMGRLMRHFLGKLDPTDVEQRLTEALQAVAVEVEE
jgi:glutamyl-tRNA(Gln) amidotransferase subunit E